MKNAPSVQVIERNLALLETYRRVLVFGPPAHFRLPSLSIERIVTFDHAVYRSMADLYGAALCCAVEPDPNLNADAAIVFLPKAKQELALVLAFVAPMLAPGAQLFLVGEKRGGIESAAKQLATLGQKYFKVDSAKHCQLWQVSVDVAPKPFRLDDWIQVYEADLAGCRMKIATMPGVFSFGRLDDGTSLLLSNLPSGLRGRVLDFGCGSGIIGCFLKLTRPELRVELVDSHRLALVCAERTCQLNGVEAKVHASDGWSDIEGRVDAVVSNPPFHAGVRTEYDTTEHFIRQARDHLNKSAPMVLVANSFLTYPVVLDQVFGNCETLAENTRFRVYLARR
jgi:16S rRNA (guanine1207-N2)-methyltransferase